MTIDDYITAVRNDPRGPQPGVYYRIATPAGRVSLPSRRPVAPPARRVPAPPAAGQRVVGYADGRPHRVCLACHEPCFPVARTLMCVGCAAEVAWRVKLAQQGFRVVS